MIDHFIDQIVAEELAFHTSLEPIFMRGERLRQQLKAFAQEFQDSFSKGLQALGKAKPLSQPSLEELMEWDQTARDLYEKGLFLEARDAFLTIVSSGPQYSAFWAGLAHALISCGEVERGLKAAKACLELNPELPMGYLACARAYLQEQDIANATAICDQGQTHAHIRLQGKVKENLIQTLANAKQNIQIRR